MAVQLRIGLYLLAGLILGAMCTVSIRLVRGVRISELEQSALASLSTWLGCALPFSSER
jgi:hypothetical protein